MKNFYKRGMLIIMFLLAMALLVMLAMGQAKAASLSTPSLFYQQPITGTVTDINGKYLPGVTLLVKNKQYGTNTDLSGNYSINANAQDTLVVTSIGFKDVEIMINGRSTINIVLEEDISSLKEVEINAGYYTTTQRERTGNISRVKAEEIENQPVVSPIQALQGRMAGVEIVSGGANPGMASTIKIRGTNSLRQDGNYPLYIIDGVPISSVPVESNSLLSTSGIDPLNNLNPANIESIEVLKDADATAIYGSRGSNGVVLITTKSGYKYGTGLEARIYTGVSTVPGRMDLLNTEEYLQVRREAFQNDGVEPDVNNAYDLVLWNQDRYTDWQEYLLGGKSEVTNANLSFTGGDENTSFRLGGSYFTQGTVYPGDYDYRKWTGDIALNHLSKNNKFRLNLKINYGTDRNNLVGNGNLDPSIILLPPNAPAIFNEDTTLNWEEWGAAGLTNPFEGFFNTTSTHTKNLTSNVLLSYEIFNGFKLKSSLGYADYQSNELWKLPARSYNPSSNPENNSFHLSTGRRSWIIEPQLTYDKKFEKFHTEFLLGGTFQTNNSTLSSFQGSAYASEALIGNLSSAESILNAKSSETEYKYAAIFSRIGLNWDKKYFLNFTARRDGSSRFGPNNRFANFGAIGAAWIISEEEFIKNNLSILSFAKLRGSYGSTGNDQIGDYGYLDSYQATRGINGLYPTSLANPDYSWEVNRKLEAALQLGFFNDRVNLGLSWYRNRSSNQLVGYSLPYITGFTSVQANLPATVENKGLEIELATLNLDKNNFSWRSNLNVTVPKNKLIDYPDLEQSSYSNTYREGYPLNIALLYDYNGLDPETALYTVKDINNDDKLDFEDRVIIKDLNRQFFGGISNHLSYRNFNLQFLFQFIKQEGIQTNFQAGINKNVLSSVLDNDRYQRYSASFLGGKSYRNVLESSFPYEDASFLRLKTLSLSYDLSSKILDRVNLKKAQLFLHGQNLWTITPYTGLDPESATSDLLLGNLRSITAGLQLNL
ncbi:SusC/RagA family TonB-linked outer membrane protein [Zunongwangia sp. H14]|uniref:SusC/RagA family TonB-linked outer membrane protein n=1 Tax=Zunongwangia sp. H14 TaxID=3240792 RepID=UPI0035685C54